MLVERLRAVSRVGGELALELLWDIANGDACTLRLFEAGSGIVHLFLATVAFFLHLPIFPLLC